MYYFLSFSWGIGRTSPFLLFLHGIEQVLVLYLQFLYFAVEGRYPWLVISHEGVFGGASFNAADIVFELADCFLFCLKDSKIV